MPEKRIHWGNVAGLVLAHLLAVAAVVYLVLVQCDWRTFLLAAGMMAACGVSITGGYHRLFAHAAYRAGWPLRLFYALFGAASVQNSALEWCADHRRHHRYTDADEDPYNIRRGFWWAHMGWILMKEPAEYDLSGVTDLSRDPILRFQRVHYASLAVGVGLLLPVAIASLWGDALGGFLVAGFLRLVSQYHSTAAVNSMAHTFGSQPYTRSGGLLALPGPLVRPGAAGAGPVP